MLHKNSNDIHMGAYWQASDPGAVGAGKMWIDTSTSAPYQLKVRNSGDTGWEDVGINSIGNGPTNMFFEQTEYWVQAQVGSTNLYGVPTNTGAVAGTVTSADDADGALHKIQSVSYSQAGRSGSANIQRRWAPDISFRFKTGDSISGLRYWVGVFSNNPFNPSTPTPAMQYAAFRYDTGADGTAFWRCLTDVTTESPTVVTTSLAVAVNTLYHLRIAFSANDVKFYSFNGSTWSLLATISTTLPNDQTALSWYLRLVPLESVEKFLYFNRVAYRQRF